MHFFTYPSTPSFLAASFLLLAPPATSSAHAVTVRPPGLVFQIDRATGASQSGSDEQQQQPKRKHQKKRPPQKLSPQPAGREGPEKPPPSPENTPGTQGGPISMASPGSQKQVPDGITIMVRLSSEINSGTTKAGDSFDGSLAEDLVSNGKPIAKKGARVKGEIIFGKSSSDLWAPELTLRVTSLELDGMMVPVSTSEYRVSAKRQTKRNTSNGGSLGSLMGGPVAGGIGAAAGSGKQEVVIPRKTVLKFVTSGGDTNPTPGTNVPEKQ
jgi:hypothetical protein